jgi:type IV pilus assembly protein PilQ
MKNVLVRRLFQAAICPLGLLLVSLAWAQQNSIETFDVTQTGGQVLVRVNMRNPIGSAPGSFTIANPARIAFDFADTTNGLGRNSQDIGEAVLRSMNLVQVGDRTRLVLNLRGMVPYESKIEGSSFLITLAAPAGTGRAAAGTPGAARFEPVGRYALAQDVNFRQGRGGEDGSWWSSRTRRPGGYPSTRPDRDRGLPQDERGGCAAQALRRDRFQHPCSPPAFFRRRQRTHGSSRAAWGEHNACQTDTQFALGEAAQYDPASWSGIAHRLFRREAVLEFPERRSEERAERHRGLLTPNIMRAIRWAETSPASKDVLGSGARHHPRTGGLDMRKNGNVIWIAPRDELATKEKLALESSAQITELEPLRTETFQLNYAKADAFAKLLADPTQRILSKRGAASVDLRTNQVFVQDVSVRLEEVRKLLGQVDVPVQQVLIEARIVEANDTFSKNLGVRMGNVALPITQSASSSGPSPIGTSGTTGVAVTTTGTVNDFANLFPAAGGTVTTKTPDNLSVNLPAAPVGNAAAAGSIALLITNRLTGALSLELSALEADGKGKIISSPRVMTANNVEALIEQGTELPYQQATSSGATAVSFRKANLALKVKPQITPDGNIIMNLDINKDSVGQATNAGFAIDTKHVLTQVLVENGGTVVIGGIYTQTLQTTITKVPFFGDLPLLGFLFRNNSRSDNKTELLVFITPRIVEQRASQR